MRGLRRPEVTSIQETEKIYSELEQRADQELREIGPSLRDLAHRIVNEKPDTIIFLDVSARIFGTPFMQYLTERMGADAPQVRFYNDDKLKGAYLEHGSESVDAVVTHDLQDLVGKKLFFVDETFSNGKGAAAIYSAKDALGGNIFYTALSVDPDPPTGEFDSYGKSEIEHAAVLKQISADPHFIFYDNPLQTVFSREASRLYMTDSAQRKLNPYEARSVRRAKGDSTIPHILDMHRPPKGMTMEEYDRKIRELSHHAAESIKRKIYATLANKSD